MAASPLRWPSSAAFPLSPPICAISDALEDASPEKAAVWRLGKLIIDHNHEVRKRAGRGADRIGQDLAPICCGGGRVFRRAAHATQLESDSTLRARIHRSLGNEETAQRIMRLYEEFGLSV